MTVRWKGVCARYSCLLVCSLVSAVTRADNAKLVVNGVLVCPSKDQRRTIGLYMERSADAGSEMAKDNTNPEGKFRLVPEVTPKRLSTLNLWVICKPSPDDTTCHPHGLKPSNYSSPQNNIISADLALTCIPASGSPAKTAEAMVALAETHEVLVWAGVETLGVADAALKDAVARADARLNPQDRDGFKAALAAAAAPLRSGRQHDLPLLPSLKRDDVAGELLAAVPIRGWLAQPEGNDQRAMSYGERDGRFEGRVTLRVGSAFSGALVSLTEGPLAVDPQTKQPLELAWAGAAGPRMCIEAKPVVQKVDWKMRVAAEPGRASFLWDLSAAGSAGIKKGELGVVARTCVDAVRDLGPYIPVRTGSAAPTPAAYRIVFLFPRQLSDVSAIVFQGEGSSRRTIALGQDAVRFDPDASAPTVTIDVPTSSLQPGIVQLEMSGSGPGRFGPERLSFLHSRR